MGSAPISRRTPARYCSALLGIAKSPPSDYAAIRRSIFLGRSSEQASDQPTGPTDRPNDPPIHRHTDRPTHRPTDSPTDRPSDRLFRNHFLRAYTCVGAPTCFLLKCIGEPMHVASANRYMGKLASAHRCIPHWPGGSSIAVALPPLRILTTRPIWRRQRALQIGDCP